MEIGSDQSELIKKWWLVGDGRVMELEIRGQSIVYTWKDARLPKKHMVLYFLLWHIFNIVNFSMLRSLMWNAYSKDFVIQR